MHASKAHAIGVLASHARASWDNVAADDGIPLDAAGLDDAEVVELYFTGRTGIETYSLYPDEVEGGTPGTGFPA